MGSLPFRVTWGRTPPDLGSECGHLCWTGLTCVQQARPAPTAHLPASATVATFCPQRNQISLTISPLLSLITRLIPVQSLLLHSNITFSGDLSFNSFFEFLFIFGYSESLFLCRLFCSCSKPGLLSRDARASHCSDFSFCRAHILGCVGSAVVAPRL